MAQGLSSSLLPLYRKQLFCPNIMYFRRRGREVLTMSDDKHEPHWEWSFCSECKLTYTSAIKTGNEQKNSTKDDQQKILRDQQIWLSTGHGDRYTLKSYFKAWCQRFFHDRHVRRKCHCFTTSCSKSIFTVIFTLLFSAIVLNFKIDSFRC